MEQERGQTEELTEPASGERRSANGEVKPFLDHLEDLRQVLIKSLIAVVICCAICFFFTDQIVQIFKWPLLSMTGKHDLGSQILRSLHPADFLMASLKLVTITGVILASPIIIYFIWEFLSPAMTSSERRISVPIFGAGLVCFLLGVAFCYFVVLRMSLGFLWNYTIERGVVPEWTFDNYVSFVSAMMLAFGVTFEFPVITAILVKFNLLKAETLKSKRRYAYLIMVILAAILTPPDVVSQMLLCVPMVGLYELSIGVAKLIEKRNVSVYEEQNHEGNAKGIS